MSEIKRIENITFGRVQIEALNQPEGWEIFDGGKVQYPISRIKTAAIEKSDSDLGGFDIKEAIKKNPEHLFVKVFAIKKDEVNDNGDAFSEDELRKAVPTFIGCPLFCNHANNDIEKARGRVVHAWYDEEKGGIMIISMVDKVAYPKLARGIEEGYINGTSMGCQVQYSLCSICHNKAHVADEYCDHVRNRKTKKMSGSHKCAYHKSKGKPTDDCPVCGCKKGESKDHEYKEAQIYEHNFGLKFIEDSFVVNPACHDCLVECVLNTDEYTKKAAEVVGRFQKAASTFADGMQKVAGRTEVDYLNKAMKYFEVVSKSMIDQKEQVSMEYVSDLVDVMAKAQTVTDELVEMGYAQLPSPPTLQNPDALADASPLNGANGQGGGQMAPGQMPPPSKTPQESQKPQQSSPSGTSSAPVGDIGSVTKPTFSPKASGNLKDIYREGSNLREKISSMYKTISTYTKEASVADADYSLTKNDLTVVIHREFLPVRGHDLIVSAFHGDSFLKMAKIEMFGSGLKSLFDEKPDEAALQIIESLSNQIKESENKMSTKNEKTAAGQGLTSESQQVTTEKQLENAKLDLHPRTNESYEGVTESKEQLGLNKAPLKDVNSDSPQVRKDEYANVTTEAQLPDIGDSPIARWNSYPEVITEKTWREFDRAVGAVLSSDQKDHTTEAQLKDLLSHHRWTEPNVTTEGQLGSKENWRNDDNAWLSKEAASAYAKRLVAAAVDALSDAIASYKRTPAELVKAATFITRDPQSQIKAAFITLVNGLPKHRATRKAEIARASYFDKAASIAPSAVDALLACMGDNCLNVKAEDLVDAIRFVASDTSKMAAVEAKAQEKLAKKHEVSDDKVVDKFAAFEEAFGEITNADGLYAVASALEEIGADPSDEAAFIDAAEKFAQSEVLSKYAKSDVVLYSIEIDDEAGTVLTTVKEASKLTNDEKKALADRKSEKTARKEAREEIVKTAQMMGGEMGGGMGGQSPGQGATLPTPPADPNAAGAPPVESFENDPAAEGGDELGGGDDLEAKPPGSICPVCGSEDVDLVEGKGHCNNPKCGSQFVVKVNIDVIKWKGVNDKGEEKAEGEEPGAADEMGEGFEMPEGGEAAEGGAAPNVPVAAMTRLSPDTLKKLAASGIEIGKASPLTGSTNTFSLGKGEFLCLDTGTQYKVATILDTKNVNNGLWVQFEWTPKYPGDNCSSCKRAKLAWSKALKNYGITDVQFDQLSFKKKADAILDMEKKGLFQVVKTASKNASVLSEFKKAFSVSGKFPIESCREKLARRYGEDGLALSGPCKGQKIADCVCEQLKKASIYSDGLALKVAETWSDRDACLECMEDYVRLGYEMEKAASICNHMKVKYAQAGELLAEELGSDEPAGGHDPLNNGPKGPEDNGPEDDFGDDPFGDSGDELGGDDLGGDPLGGGDTGVAGKPEESTLPDEGSGVPEGPVDPLSGETVSEKPAPAPVTPTAPAGVEPGGKPGTVKIEVPVETVMEGLQQAISGGGAAPAAETPLPGVESPVELPGEGEAVVEIGEAPLQEQGEEIGKEIGEEAQELGELGNEIEEHEEAENTENADKGLGEEPSEPELDSPVDEAPDFGGENEGESKEDSEEKGIETKEPEVSDDNKEVKEGNDADRFASYMRRGKISGHREINLDLKNVIATLKRQAGEVEPKIEGAQDVVDNYSAGDGSTQGDEKKFDADEPSVPRDTATIGAEESDRNPKDKPLPKVPSDPSGANIGNEKEQGYTSEAPNMSGGSKGQGKTPTASAKKTVKTADEKLKPAKPDSEVTTVEFSNNKDHSKSGKPRKPFEESDSKEIKNVPERGEGSFIGDEKTSIEFVPKAPKDQPSIPAGGGRNEKYDKNEKNAPELQTQIRGVKASDNKGTVVAEGDEKSQTISRLASKMLKAQLIDETELLKKVAELQAYQLTQLADMEKMMDQAATKVAKGLATEPDGVEQTVPLISEASNQPKPVNAQEELRKKLSSYSTLQKQNVAAHEIGADERKAFGR